MTRLAVLSPSDRFHRQLRQELPEDDDGSGAGHAVTSGPAEITDREREVLHEFSMGRSNRHIAERLGISENTVKYHLSSLFARLGVTNRSQAVFEGMRRGWVTL